MKQRRLDDRSAISTASVAGEKCKDGQFEVTRSLDLNPEDWLWATWEPRQPLPKPHAQSFDRKQCLIRLKRVFGTYTSGYVQLNWSNANIGISLSDEEACFWFCAMTHEAWGEHAYYCDRAVAKQVFNSLSMQSFSDELSVEEIVSRLQQSKVIVGLPIISVLYNLTSITKLAVRCHQTEEMGLFCHSLSEHFRTTLRCYLTDKEITVLQDDLRPGLKPNEPFHSLYLLAGCLGMSVEVRQQVDNWRRDPRVPHYVVCSQRQIRRQDAILMMLGLGHPQATLEATRGLNILLESPEHVRGWLACTAFSDLGWVCFSILEAFDKKVQQALLKAFTQSVRSPEAAPYMLELWLLVSKPKWAHQWLEDNLTVSVVGLIPVVAGNSYEPIEVSAKKLIEAAVGFLVSVRRRGHKALFEYALKAADVKTVKAIQDLVIAPSTEGQSAFDKSTTPLWLSEGISDLLARKKRKKKATIEWIYAADLPGVVVGEHCLSWAQSQLILEALKLGSVTSPLPLVTGIKHHGTVESVDAFVWALFERWLVEGAESKEKWAMQALGLLGSDAIALKLTPLIRKWPGESQHSRAVMGLECLRAIGSDTALMQINGIAQKVKYRGIKRRAQECLVEIAGDRNLTPEQLADRIIPDCGLDARGNRVFDFGPRQFHFVLGGDLKPQVRDAGGKLRVSLPKPNKKDDAELATQATTEWKLMKKQISAIVKLQALRLEQAMVSERRWPLGDFQQLLLGHPLMSHLVERLVWGRYNLSGRLVSTFRVAEDGSFCDEADDTVDLADAFMVSVIHPIYLSEESRASWGEALSDYEIIPPFAQIDREIYALAKAEESAEEIERFVDVKVPSIVLPRIIEQQGWLRGQLQDHGDYNVHYKYFEAADLTAVVGDYEHQHVAYYDRNGDVDAINACLFLEGYHKSLSEYPRKGSWYGKRIKTKYKRLGDVPPVVMSEVLRDLSIVAEAAVES